MTTRERTRRDRMRRSHSRLAWAGLASVLTLLTSVAGLTLIVWWILAGMARIVMI